MLWRNPFDNPLFLPSLQAVGWLFLFAIAVVLGVSLGIAAAVSPPVNAAVKPIVRVLASSGSSAAR